MYEVSKNDIHAAVLCKFFTAKPSYKGMVMVDINIRFPQIVVYGNPGASQQISSFYRDSAKQYYDYASKELFDKAVKAYLESNKRHCAFRPFKAVQAFEKQYNHGQHLSISYERNDITAAKFADTWQLFKGSRLLLEDFFENSYYKSVFFNYITEEIQKQIDGGKNSYSNDFKVNVFRCFDEKNYYLNENGISVFYPVDTIAGYDEGFPAFTIPYDSFGQSLKRNIFI